METIADFISKDDEIARLNAQINMIAKFYKSYYKLEVKTLNKRINKLVRRECKTNKLLLSANINRHGDRSIKAVKMIELGGISLREIAKTCHLGYTTVKNLSHKAKVA